MTRRFQFSLIVGGVLALAAIAFCSFVAGVLYSRIETDEILKRQADNFQNERKQLTESLGRAVSDISKLEMRLELEKHRGNPTREK